MPNNFKIQGNIYVSVAGSDANNGTTPDTPKRTLSAAINMATNGQSIVIGAGVYYETINRNFGANFSLNIYADGEVIIDGAYRQFFYSGGFAGVIAWYDITFKNYSDFQQTLDSNPGVKTGQFYRCKFINMSMRNPGGPIRGDALYSQCIFINTIMTFDLISGFGLLTNPDGSVLRNCILINFKTSSLNSGFIEVTNCYIDPSSFVLMHSTATTSSFDKNNIQGTVQLRIASTVTSGTFQDAIGQYYDLSRTGTTGDGTVENPFTRDQTGVAVTSSTGTAAYDIKPLTFANLKLAYPTYNPRGISSNPLFNNILNQDFSLQPTSPLVGLTDATTIVTRVSANGNELYTNASVTQLTLKKDVLTITPSFTEGEIISSPIQVNTSPAKVLQKIKYNGLLEFDKSKGTGPVSGNQNVPDQLTYTGSAAGANPDRLTYYMRISTKDTQPSVDSDWDNAGMWNTADYNMFEWNTKPYVDSEGVGNGDVSHNPNTTKYYLKANWIQLKIKLRNNYA